MKTSIQELFANSQQSNSKYDFKNTQEVIDEHSQTKYAITNSFFFVFSWRYPGVNDLPAHSIFPQFGLTHDHVKVLRHREVLYDAPKLATNE